jgi:hypothetical protein
MAIRFEPKTPDTQSSKPANRATPAPVEAEAPPDLEKPRKTKGKGFGRSAKRSNATESGEG